MVSDDGVDADFSDDPIFEVLGDVFGVLVPGVVGGDGLGSFQVVIDFFSIEEIEYKLSTRVHEVLVYVIHVIVDDDVSYSLLFIVFKVLLLLQ